ncbi:MAG: hypothetical protein M1834_007507 [Cirrosporium novae-zelandiae]|nr:MAG: hypothetical protein M1834_007507 [Cirrosporium novae-zelandiae]
MKRVSRACLRCRSRKSRCDLDSSGKPGTPPCQRCVRDQVECILGGSNRGGRRIRKTVAAPENTLTTTLVAENNSAIGVDDLTRSRLSNFASSPTYASNPVRQSLQTTVPSPESHRTSNIREIPEEETASEIDSAIASTDIRNPSDAWQLLTDVATRGLHEKTTDLRKACTIAGLTAQTPEEEPARREYGDPQQNPPAVEISIPNTSSYRLIMDGSLTPAMVSELVTRFAERYHPYLPLVPRKFLDPSNLGIFVVEEPHLLTAIITIASTTLVEYPYIHRACSKYMHELISEIAAGKECDVEAVEALLLLAEWEPQGLRVKVDDIGRGEEDRAAWMHVGLALRSGYFLGLDQTSFRSVDDEKNIKLGRRRLAWASCYVADRLVSVRIGRAFWSRGPGPTSAFRSQDFPSLLPINAGDEDYASIFQATLELTQLYNNVHDVLYSGMSTNKQIMLVGDYVKYIDDFRISIYGWKRLWGSLKCSPNLKATLILSYENLRLYTTAFAFQATITRTMSSRSERDPQTVRERVRAAFTEPASMPDARFIYESMDAAKQYLTTLNNYVDPETCLRYLPVKFYLYTIYTAVFLYKARSLGTMSLSEEADVRQLVNVSIDRLRRASFSSQDLGSRYARLLELLWDQSRLSRSATTSVTPDLQSARLPDVNRGQGVSSYSGFNPITNFSWLDIGAVGDYVSNPSSAAVTNTYPMNGSSLQATADIQQPWGYRDRLSWDNHNWVPNEPGYIF